MKGAGEEGEAKKGSSSLGGGLRVVSSDSVLVLDSSAKISDLTLGVLPSGLSSGPAEEHSQLPILFISGFITKCAFYLAQDFI